MPRAYSFDEAMEKYGGSAPQQQSAQDNAARPYSFDQAMSQYGQKRETSLTQEQSAKYNDISSRYDKLLKDYTNSYNARKRDTYRTDAQDYYNAASASAKNLRSTYDEMMKFLDDNRGSFSYSDYQGMRDRFNYNNRIMNDVLNYAKQDIDFYGSFADENEFNKYATAQKSWEDYLKATPNLDNYGRYTDAKAKQQALQEEYNTLLAEVQKDERTPSIEGDRASDRAAMATVKASMEAARMEVARQAKQAELTRVAGELAQANSILDFAQSDLNNGRNARASAERGKALIDAETERLFQENAQWNEYEKEGYQRLLDSGDVLNAQDYANAVEWQHGKYTIDYKRPTDSWTQAELDRFYIIADQYGIDEADDYAYKINQQHTQKNFEEKTAKAFADGYGNGNKVGNFLRGVGGTAFQLGTAPLQVVDWLDKVADTAQRGGHYVGKENPWISDKATAFVSGRAQALNDDYGTIGGKGFGDVYQLANSMAQSMVYGGVLGEPMTLGIFFGQAANSSFDEAIQKGVDPEKAVLLSALSGTAEVLGEKVSLESLFDPAKYAKGNIWKLAGGQGLIEGSEEGFTDLLNLFGDQIASKVSGSQTDIQRQIQERMANGETYDEASRNVWKDFAKDVAWDVAGGFLSGGGNTPIMQGISNASSYTGKRLGMQGYYGADAQQIVNEAKTQLDGKDLRAADALQRKIDNNKRVTNKEVTKLVNATNRSALVAATEQQIKSRYENVADPRRLANAIVSQARGDRVSDGQRRVLKEYSEAADAIGREVSDDTPPLWVHAVGMRGEDAQKFGGVEEAKQIRRMLGTDVDTGVLETEQGTITSYENKGGADVFTVKRSDGSEYKAYAAELRTQDGKQQFKADQAKAALAQRIMRDSWAADQQTIMSSLFGKGTYDNFDDAWKAFKSQSVYSMTEQQAREAWKNGKAAETKPTLKHKGTGKVTREAPAINDGVKYETLNDEEWNAYKQTSKYKEIAALAKNIGTFDVRFFRNPEVNGKLQGVNGYYQDGVIYLSVNASSGTDVSTATENYVMLTAAHELTHFLREANPQAYAELQKYVQDELVAKGILGNGDTFVGLVMNKKANYAAAGQNISIDEALEEVVADGCEMMLRDNKRLAQFNAQHEEGGRHVLRWLRRFTQRIKAAFTGEYARHTESAELEKSFNKIQKIWTEGLIDTAEVQETGESENTGKASIKSDAESTAKSDAEATVADIQKEYTELSEQLKNLRNSPEYLAVTESKPENPTIAERREYGRKLKDVQNKLGITEISDKADAVYRRLALAKKLTGALDYPAAQLSDEIRNVREQRREAKQESTDIQNSEEYKAVFNALLADFNDDNVAAFKKYTAESGLDEAIATEKLLGFFEDKMSEALESNLADAENAERQKAMEKSGLEEAEFNRKQAVKEFGYTPYFYDAGYILPNGKMLNFSGEKGKHFNTRGQDHRAIGTIYPSTYSGTDAMVKFMSEGNIRIMAESPGIDISSAVEPSKEQYAAISKFVNESKDKGFFNVDITDANGRTIANLQYNDSFSAAKVTADIKHFYQTGEVRQQSVVSQFHGMFSIKPDAEIESENISNGNAAISKLIEKAKTADNPSDLVEKNVMYRSDIGNIDFKWGTPGVGVKFKKGYGLSHIIAKRDSENGNGVEAAYRMVEVIARSTEVIAQSNDFSSPENERLKMIYDDAEAILTKSSDGRRWLLTGWDNKKEVIAYADGEVSDSSDATAVNPTQTRLDGVDALTSSNIISQENQNSNPQNGSASLKDSEGNSLSAQQQEFFKDSKVRDENGNLLRVYRGSKKGGYNSFSYSKVGTHGGSQHGYGFYFSESKKDASMYSEGSGIIMDGYLNITNPIDAMGHDLTSNMMALFDAMPASMKLDVKSTYGSLENAANKYARYTNGDMLAILPDAIDTVPAAFNFALMRMGYDGVVYQEEGYAREFVAFASEQFKYATNKNPTDREDFRFSLKDADIAPQPKTAEQRAAEAERSRKALEKENRALRQRVEYWKKQTRRTKVNTVNSKDVAALSRQLINELNSNADRAAVTQGLQELGDYLVQKTGDELHYFDVRKKAEKIADMIVKGSVTVSDELSEQREELVSYLRTNPMRITDNTASELKENEVYRRNRGTIKLNGTVGVDSRWVELQEQFGEGVFPSDITAQSDMVTLIAETLDAWRPEENSTFIPGSQRMNEAREYYTDLILDEMMSEDIRQTAPTTADRADKKLVEQRNKDAERLAKFREAANSRIEQLKQDKAAQRTAATEKRREAVAKTKAKAKASKDATVAKERQKRDEAVAKTKEKYQDQIARGKEARTKTAIRNKIKKLYADISTRATNPKEGKYIPKPLLADVASILELINLDSGRSKALSAKIDELNKTYQKLAKENSEYKNATDDGIAEMLMDLSTMLSEKEDTSIYDMSVDELELVYNVLAGIDTVARNAIKVISIEDNRNVFQIASELIKETNATDGGKDSRIANMLQHWRDSILSPERFFSMMGGWHKGSTWEEMGSMLNEAQRKETQIKMEAAQIFQELMDDEKALRELTSTKNLIDVGLKDENGNAVMITKDMALKIYLESMAEDNAKHIMRGGYTVPNVNKYYNGKISEAYGKGRVGIKGYGKEFSDLDYELRHAETNEDKEAIKKRIADTEQAASDWLSQIRSNIYDQMGEYEHAWVKAALQFFNEFSKDYLNETTLKVYGFEKATVDNYIPIHTDAAYRQANFESIARDFSLENAGFMKSRIGASNPVLLEGLVDVVARQIDNVAAYSAMMPALKDFNKVYSKGTVGYQTSVQDALLAKHGTSATKYIENIIADMNGARKKTDGGTFEEAMGWLRGNLARSALTMNLNTALAQTASYPTAAAVVGWKPLAQAFADVGENPLYDQQAREELAKYSPLLWLRMNGYLDREVGDIRSSNKPIDRAMNSKKLRFLTGWIETMDGLTVGKLWKAAQYYVRDNFTDLEDGSEEFMQKSAEIFNKIVEKTQPNYTMFQRPDILRNPSSVLKLFTTFMTQRAQNANILMEAVGRYNAYAKDFRNGKNGATAEDMREVRRDLARAVSSQVAATLTIVAFKFLASALTHNLKKYKDDDDELTAESITSAMLDMALESMAGNFLWGGEIYSAMHAVVTGEKYYGVSLSGLDSFLDAGQSLINMVQQPSKDSVWKFVRNGAQMLGIPLNNATNIGTGVYRHVKDMFDGNFLQFNRSTAEGEPSDEIRAKRLYNALHSDDTKRAEELKAEYKTENELQTVLQGEIKRRYRAGELDYDTALAELRGIGGMNNYESTKVMLNLRMEQDTGIKYTELQDAYVEGEVDYETAVTYRMTYGGEDRNEAEETVDRWRMELETGSAYADLEELYLAGDVSQDEAVDMMVEYGGLSDADASKRAKKWQMEYDTGIPYEKMADAYNAGTITKEQMIDYFGEYGMYELEDALKKADKVDFISGDDSLDGVSESAATKYYGYGLDDTGFSKSLYLEMWYEIYNNIRADKKPDGKSISGSALKKKLAYIDGFNLTTYQKTAMALAVGITDTQLKKYKAPWL